MKQSIQRLNIIVAVLFVSMLMLASCGTAQQTTSTKEPVATSIDSNRWDFNVQMVRPQEGMNRIPNGTYSVTYTTGKLNVYLPYFGRAFSGAEVFGTSKSALDFISKDFTVEKEQQGEGKWRIVVKPKDQRQVQSMTFVLFSNGSGSLDIIMTNRSPISYTGTVSRAKG